MTDGMRRWLGLAALVAAGLIVVGLAVYTIVPVPAVVTTERGDTRITLASDDHRLLTFHDCMTVNWQVENATAVRLNGADAPTADTATFCGEPVRFRVEASGGAIIDARLDPSVVVADPLAAYLVVALTALTAVGVWLLRPYPPVVLLALLMFLLALLPRLATPASPLTTDETMFWYNRSAAFRSALVTGNFREMLQTHHPGALTMWLGTIGLTLRDLIGGADATHTLVRPLVVLPAIIVNSLAVMGIYLLTRRLLDNRIALLSAILIAFSPFLIAHSQILHIDALTTSFSVLCFLTALVAFRFDERIIDRASRSTADVRRGWLLLAGVFGGLATLAKMTALFLIPIVAVVALILYWHPRQRFWRSLPFFTGLLFIDAMAVTWGLLYPVVFVDPSSTLVSFGRGVRSAINAHELGNYFMGSYVEDPGPLFYPVTLALRLTPWGLVGAGLGLVAAVRERRQRFGQVILMGSLYALIFLVLMTVQGKKFDRYLLPIYPMLYITAAYGFVRLLGWVGATRRRVSPVTRAAAWAGLIALLFWHTARLQPNTLTYYSPLGGGAAAAPQMLIIGWGDGLERVAQYVSNNVPSCDQRIISWYDEVLNTVVTCGVVEDITPTPADFDAVAYVIFYTNQLQRGMAPEMIAALADLEPVERITANGIELAQIYDVTGVDLAARVQLADSAATP